MNPFVNSQICYNLHMATKAITTISNYNSKLLKSDKQICNLLYDIINNNLPNSESKLWHGHPVWFLAGNPIVGYSKLKDSVRLLFWSGQSFDEPGLQIEGSYKAADKRYTSLDQINLPDLARWLSKSRSIQYDYKNIVKNRGRLALIKSTKS